MSTAKPLLVSQYGIRLLFCFNSAWWLEITSIAAKGTAGIQFMAAQRAEGSCCQINSGTIEYITYSKSVCIGTPFNGIIINRYLPLGPMKNVCYFTEAFQPPVDDILKKFHIKYGRQRCSSRQNHIAFIISIIRGLL